MLIFLKSIFCLFTFIGILKAQNGLKVSADNVQVQEDKSITINVLKNDNIKNKDNLLLEILTKPEKGTAQVQGEKILYTPNLDVSGIDQFEYKVDIGTGAGTGKVRVNINPVNDAPTGISLSETKIKENAAPGTALGRIKVEDPDVDDSFKFGLAKENRDDFSLDGSNLLTKRPFNFEQEKSFSISIQVTDSGGEKYVGAVDIDVENVIPFVIVANPVIEIFGVNVSSEIIAIKFPSLYHFVIFCVASVESKIESYVNPFVVPVVPGGPTKTLVVPL